MYPYCTVRYTHVLASLSACTSIGLNVFFGAKYDLKKRSFQINVQVLYGLFLQKHSPLIVSFLECDKFLWQQTLN